MQRPTCVVCAIRCGRYGTKAPVPVGRAMDDQGPRPLKVGG